MENYAGTLRKVLILRSEILTFKKIETKIMETLNQKKNIQESHWILLR